MPSPGTIKCLPLQHKNIKFSSPNIKAPFRFTDHHRKNNSFGAVVVSRSESPSYSLSFVCKKQTAKPLNITPNADGTTTTATTPTGSKVYPRTLAKAGPESKEKEIVIYTPSSPTSTPQHEPYKNRITKKPRALDFSSTSKQLTQEYTFQCGSQNNNYTPKRSKSQKQVMHQSAKAAIEEALLTMPEIYWPPTLTSVSREWCHLIPHRDSQFKLLDPDEQKQFIPQTPANLVASTNHLNSKMLVFEETASFLLKRLPKSFALKTFTTCQIIAGSNNVMIENMLQKISILYKGEDVLTLNQSIPHDFGTTKEDCKQFAAMKDVYTLIAFVMNSLTEKLGASALQHTSYKAQEKKAT